jgi:cobalt/nickel transport system permease protein
MLPAPIAMHIPDGFLSVPVSFLLWIVIIIMIGYALKRVSADIGERQVPLMGVLAAAIFAGQMLNFAVAGGTSGHLMGSAIATILLGPWAAMLVITCVVSIQALIFQDGGLLVLGANSFNMAILGVSVAYMVYRTVHILTGGKSWGIFAGGFIAAWLSIEAAALATALELSLSGTSPANIAIAAMGGIHALIGIGEGLITLGALAFLYASRRDLLKSGADTPINSKFVWVIGFALALLLAVASPLASSRPDGLEWVADQKGFLNLAKRPFYEIIPDYLFPGASNTTLATIVAGVIGVLIVFVVALVVAMMRHRKTTSK